MSKTPEQLAAKRERQRREALIPVGTCGHKLSLYAQEHGSGLCNACQDRKEEADAADTEAELMRRRMDWIDAQMAKEGGL